MINLDDKKIKEKLPQIKKLLNNKDVDLFIVPSAFLRELVLKGEHPLIQGIPDGYKSIILQGLGIAIEKSLVTKWIEGKLDAKNSFVLENSDIRVVQDQDIKLWDPKDKKIN